MDIPFFGSDDEDEEDPGPATEEAETSSAFEDDSIEYGHPDDEGYDDADWSGVDDADGTGPGRTDPADYGTSDGLSHPIGLYAVGNRFEPVLEAGRDLPASATRTFTTGQDGQRSVELTVLRGVSGGTETARDEEVIDRVVFEGLPAAAAGTVEIDVTFAVDRAGDLTIAADVDGADYHREVRFEDVV